jgi:serine/threonine-protein kinase
VILLTGVTALVWRPWERPSTAPSTFPPVPTALPTTSVSIPAPPPPPPPPPVFPDKSIDSLLLSAAELSDLLGIRVTNDTGDDSGGLKLDASSYGTSDRSGQVTPRSCVGVAFTAQHDLYDGADFQAIRTESFSRSYGSLTGKAEGPDRLEQTAVVFPSAELAQQFLASAGTQWNACANTEVDVILWLRERQRIHGGQRPA